MELRNLRHVVALSRMLNYVKASEDLALSQSALSRSIQATERELGLKLFDRDRGGVRLTREGRQFAARAQALLAEADDLKLTMQRTASSELGQVTFGVEPLPARALVPNVLAKSLAANPNLQTRVLVRSIEALAELLMAGEIEFFVSAEGRLADRPPMQIKRLGYFRLSLLVRAQHPALGGEAGLATYPVLLAGEAGELAGIVPGLAHLLAGPRHIVEDYELLAELTARSDAVLLSSPSAMHRELSEGRLRELRPARSYEPPLIPIALHTLERRSLSPGALKLTRAIHQEMRRLTAE